MSVNWSIETHDLTKRFGGYEAVRALNLKVPAHQITGFLGNNGAGKSTTIKMLLGMTHPSSGSGTVLGKRIDDARQSREMRRHVAYVAEDKQLYAYLTVEEMIRFTRSFYEDWRTDTEQRLLRQYRLPLDRKVKSLSKGMRTKLALLLALARQPELLILDEPSDALDPASIEELLQALVAAAGEGTTVFFSSHQIGEVERIADRVCIVDQGRVVGDLDLDQLRENYRKIVASFSGEVPGDLFSNMDVEQVQIRGRQVVVLTKRDSAHVVARAWGAGAVSVDVEPVSLRELFLDMTRRDG
ncbi:MAG: ABC transporter ATP-binding protein [Sphingomonas sp.]